MICCSWHESHSSTSEVQTLVSNRSTMSSALARHPTYRSISQVPDSNSVRTLDSLKLKDPSLALFYAVIPGLVLHGSGHMYAGEVPTAIILFGCELVGAGVAIMGALSQIEGPSEPGQTTVLIGSVVFWGTWIYDFVGSPMVVNKKNSTLLDQEKVGLELQTKDTQPGVVIVWHF